MVVDVLMGSIAQGEVTSDRLALDGVAVEVLGIDGCPSVNMPIKICQIGRQAIGTRFQDLTVRDFLER